MDRGFDVIDPPGRRRENEGASRRISHHAGEEPDVFDSLLSANACAAGKTRASTPWALMELRRYAMPDIEAQAPRGRRHFLQRIVAVAVGRVARRCRACFPASTASQRALVRRLEFAQFSRSSADVVEPEVTIQFRLSRSPNFCGGFLFFASASGGTAERTR